MKIAVGGVTYKLSYFEKQQTRTKKLIRHSYHHTCLRADIAHRERRPMSWHIHSSARVFDSDAYGSDTDSPASAYEIIDQSLKLKDEIAISDKIIEFIKDTAEEYFNTSEWEDDMWDAWKDKFTELM